MNIHDRPHVVIVGAGFGGLYAARSLKDADVRITVIDRRNYHLFQPLLYQVATAGLSPADIAYPIRSVLNRQKNTRVFLAEATSIDVNARKVILQDGETGYDYLILAAGACHSYFGHPEWEIYAPGLKGVDDALEIRRRILLAFEKAEREMDEVRRRALLTFVIVGGGPTGVELAGAIGEIACQVMVGDFRAINPQDARIILIEAGPRVLPSFPEDLSTKAEASLKRLSVDVRKNSPVTTIQPNAVVIGDEYIPAATVLWAAGVAASPLARSLRVPLDRAGRVLVEPDLSIPGHPEVFVIGDLAAFVHQGGCLLPGLAPVAIQQGRHAALNILRRCRGLPSEAFRYVDRGTLATIGRAAAVANFGTVKLSGFLAWIAWIFIHIFFLIGFRNRFIVLFEWAWAYVTWHRSARLITGGSNRISHVSL
ncbi:NAD(P)/FAD-dependent oxidoreductase [Candidatus Methylomirabilis sp.]|uniref:NAD(P)/FAD-dependent oxidoreductase n=1 Tax=Candidatus Methylomirabilis sp. TaxID=2032687 RepID=UPI002A5C268F|nr:NAD(P)/FAD-dependent oxidoreductase [Candidatus Methylomirabilis sp.]